MHSGPKQNFAWFRPLRWLQVLSVIGGAPLVLAGCLVQQPSVTPAKRTAQFDHTGFTSTCIACHSGDLPSGPAGSAGPNGTTHFDHSQGGGTGDCVTCHASIPANIGVTWEGALFGHSPQTTSCVACHVSDRPSGPVGMVGTYGTSQFDHSLGGGTGDCVTCHTLIPANIGVQWAGGYYSHSPAPTTCITCHIKDRPVGPAGTQMFDHANGGQGDCVVCHNHPGVTFVEP